MYQMNTKWSFGAGFEYIEHADNGVKSIHTHLKTPVVPQQFQDNLVNGLLEKTKNMKDGWEEYVIKTNVGYQLTDDIQFTGFIEYTLDDGHSNSQNATDCKIETGVRLNARF